ncbi:hypothetical protein [Parabacteroides sp. ZJ-118]|uniref:hypothetical protein n=1 Tax=Parabacteroides sp. ZJ-118 TaxID=2709398 RepID=UPI0013EDA362|nr:hypothetical protein [Parabacteroides sp. ZJ-118]
MDMTTYIYKGEEISKTQFLLILRNAGINGGRKLSAYEALVKCAELGKEKAIKILNDLEVIEK